MNKYLSIFLLPIIAFVSFSCESESGENTSNWPQPIIMGVSTEFDGIAVSGLPVELTGKNFSPTESDNKIVYGVGLNTISIEVTEADEDRIVFIAPQCDKDELSIKVVTKGKESNSKILKFDNTLAVDMPVDISEILDKATVVQVREGVEWIHFHGLWEGAIRNINIVKTTLNEHNKLGIYYDYKNTEVDRNLDAKCEFLDALIGTNGPMACCHFVRVNGKTMRNPIETDAYFVSNAALTIDDNVPDIVRIKDNFDAAKLPNKNIGCGGPMLVYEGRIQKYDEDETAEFLKTTHPRTAFGITEDQKTVIQVAVDGRWTTGATNKRAIGMPTPLLSKLMKGLGCYKALNFDGGGGTAMWIYGYGVNGIVNHPCDSPMNWDNPTLRAAGNAVYIYSDLK